MHDGPSCRCPLSSWSSRIRTSMKSSLFAGLTPILAVAHLPAPQHFSSPIPGREMFGLGSCRCPSGPPSRTTMQWWGEWLPALGRVAPLEHCACCTKQRRLGLSSGSVRLCLAGRFWSHFIYFFLLLWLSFPSGFLVVFEKPNRSSFTFTFTWRTDSFCS
jgi:hypothetical protein